MLESELNDTQNNDSTEGGSGAGELNPSAPAVPAAVFQPPQVVFQPPAVQPEPPAPSPAAGSSRPAGTPGGAEADGDTGDDDGAASGRRRRRRSSRSRARGGDQDAPAEAGDADPATDVAQDAQGQPESQRPARTRSRRSGAAKDVAKDSADAPAGQQPAAPPGSAERAEAAGPDDAGEDGESPATGGRRRRRKRRRGSAEVPAGTDAAASDDPPDTVVHVREPSGPDDVRSVKGSTRLEAKKQRRREGRETGRRRPPIITESEFLARRESVERTMVVRQRKDRTQIAVLEDGDLGYGPCAAGRPWSARPTRGGPGTRTR